MSFTHCVYILAIELHIRVIDVHDIVLCWKNNYNVTDGRWRILIFPALYEHTTYHMIARRSRAHGQVHESRSV